MSKFVDEIVESIKVNRMEWSPVNHEALGFRGIASGSLSIEAHGHGRLLSMIELSIDGKDQRVSYSDRWKLEVAVSNWKHNASLSMIKGES